MEGLRLAGAAENLVRVCSSDDTKRHIPDQSKQVHVEHHSTSTPYSSCPGELSGLAYELIYRAVSIFLYISNNTSHAYLSHPMPDSVTRPCPKTPSDPN